jgi:pilus assembly protein CpaC
VVLALGLLLTLLPTAARAQPAPSPGVIVQVNGTEIRQMDSKKRIKNIQVSNPLVIQVTAVKPDTYAIVGLAPGISTVTLTDEDNKVERLDVVVVAYDIEQLRTVLRRAVPSASVVPLPAGNNAVILSGTIDRAEDVPAVLQAAQSVVGPVQIINTLRVGGVQQVQICVTVARVNRTKLRQFGFNFLFNGPNLISGSTVGNLIPPLTTIGIPSATLQPSFAGQILNSPPGATNLFTGIITRKGGFLGFLQALETQGLAKIMAEPRLVSLSGRQASFLDGGEQAVPVPAGLGQIGVQFEEFGTRLNFIPIVLGNGKIHLEVEPEVSQLDAAAGTSIGGTIVPGRVTQRVRTTVEIEDGQTLVIGGLLQHQVNASLIRVPYIGALPFVGALFSTKSFQEVDTELVIIITPHLIDPMDCSQTPKLLPGQETRSADDFELFLEGLLEAPRGSREVFPGRHYLPAYKNGPSSAVFPCGGPGGPHGVGCVGGGAPAAVTETPHVLSQPQRVPVKTEVPMPEAGERPEPDTVKPATLPKAPSKIPVLAPAEGGQR